MLNQPALTYFIEDFTIDGKNLTVYDFWGYGCYCLPAGGTPLSGGYGEPVDNLDRICFNRKRCINCLEIEKPNEDCDPETIKYKFRTKITRSGEKTAVCTNTDNTCAKFTCECDLRLAKEIRALLMENIANYNLRFNVFKGKFDRDISCVKRHNGGTAPDMCCDDGTGYMLAYSSLTHDCCPSVNGGNAVRMIGNC